MEQMVVLESENQGWTRDSHNLNLDDRLKSKPTIR
jgi:hypothetical protein